jgi:uncharacterized membrane protein
MDRDGSIDLIDAAVIVRTRDGKVRFHETADAGPLKWAARGAVAGGILGLVFPPSLIVSAAVGGGAGAIWGRFHDRGIKDDELKAIGDGLEPGSSAIIAVAEDHVIEHLEQGLDGYERLARHTVSAETAAVISDAAAETRQKAGAPA